ncbi:AtpZ/AtpI family protein [Anaerosalibacter bizertensis]|uniref:AtpZ/AtpI family protein n=1 Tax=Anaerosalibacter bizertensis TaxID=932217 RepID=A0A844FGU3_9FIRM|nr:AtpZ/AtpI family protein [Anaerosalibacter bizertensis]MSS43283.1 AtpZ/AtpI family protein [Anaerosalibacter bizertensis]
MKNNNKKTIGEGIALITQVGLSIITPILIGVYLGNLMDKKLNTGMVFTIIFIIVGALSGFMNLFKLGNRKTEKGSEVDASRRKDKDDNKKGNSS